MKAFRLFATVFVLMLLLAAPSFAADSPILTNKATASFGVGLAIIGAGFGFGKIGASALESMARQPEVAGQVRGAMIVIAALLEGATFFGLLICMIALFV